MSYYSLTLPSIKETFLTSTFSIQDVIDINFLIKNKDNKGLDLYVDKKFKENTGRTDKLYAIDKFIYLFSQRIFSVGENVELKKGENSTFKVSLINLYNEIAEKDFILKEEFNIKEETLWFSLPYHLDEQDNIIAIDKEGDNIPVSSLPIDNFKQASNFFSKNNNLIDQNTYKKIFLEDFTLTNEYILDLISFLYSENINSIYENMFTLCSSYNYDIGVMKDFSSRELYLHILTVNNYVKQKNKEKKQYESNP